jgi:hypothetical protein
MDTEIIPRPQKEFLQNGPNHIPVMQSQAPPQRTHRGTS